jgi:hypothetical protein
MPQVALLSAALETELKAATHKHTSLKVFRKPIDFDALLQWLERVKPNESHH